MANERGEAAAFTLQDANQILEYWRDFDLDGRRVSLDKQCLEMRELKTTSMTGRKRLNDLTKAFRARPQEQQLQGITEVLKAYQEEIDQLSRRAKFSEAAFYALYKSVFEAPDPCAALDGLVAMLAATSTHGLEIERLRAELVQYDEEFQQLKNQDITIRRLEEQLQEYRDRIEDKVGFLFSLFFSLSLSLYSLYSSTLFLSPPLRFLPIYLSRSLPLLFLLIPLLPLFYSHNNLSTYLHTPLSANLQVQEETNRRSTEAEAQCLARVRCVQIGCVCVRVCDLEECLTQTNLTLT